MNTFLVRERMLRESILRKRAAPNKSAHSSKQDQTAEDSFDGPSGVALNGNTGVRPTLSNISVRVNFF